MKKNLSLKKNIYLINKDIVTTLYRAQLLTTNECNTVTMNLISIISARFLLFHCICRICINTLSH